MMRTIPYMCLVCGEIVDVAVSLGETGPGRCPMCGGELTCDFDLPVNEHVRVEVQTPERLRFSFPFSLESFSASGVVGLLVLNGPPTVGFVTFLRNWVTPPGPAESIKCLLAAILCIGYLVFLNTVLFLQWWGHKVIEIDHIKYAMTIVLHKWRWTKKVPLTKIQNVIHVTGNEINGTPHQDSRRGFCILKVGRGCYF